MKKMLFGFCITTSLCMLTELAIAGPFDFFSSNRAKQQNVSSGTAMSKEKMRGIFDASKFREINQCAVATLAYKTTQDALKTKKAICDAMNIAKEEKDKYNDIFWELFDMRFAAPGGPSGACGNFIQSKKDEMQQKRDEAEATFWAKWEECNFGEGPSLQALEATLEQAEENVCTACDNQWPDSLNDASGSGFLLYHCPPDFHQ